ncbi:hypothetical protein F2P56_015884, partial [Juglans regia]
MNQLGESTTTSCRKCFCLVVSPLKEKTIENCHLNQNLKHVKLLVRQAECLCPHMCFACLLGTIIVCKTNESSAHLTLCFWACKTSVIIVRLGFFSLDLVMALS